MNAEISIEKDYLNSKGSNSIKIEDEKKIIIDFFERWVDRPLEDILYYDK